MPDSRHPSHRPDGSTEDRFLHWVDHLVDPTTGAAPPSDPDFADVAETAHSIHRAAGLGAATAPSPQRADAMWESLMHTTTMPASTVDPAAFNGNAPPVALRPVTTEPGPGWRSWLMAAALIAVVVVASVITIWRITDPLDDRNPGTANQPGFIASATPATESPDGCDLTRDMLVFVGEAPSFEGTDLDPTIAVVQPDGDFVVTCNGVKNPEPLMTGITNATPLQWPGTVLLERNDGSAVVVNVATGEQVELGNSAAAYGMYSVQQFSPSWVVSPNNAAATDWRITNLEMMTSFALSDELGGVLEEPRTLTIDAPYGSPVAVISFDGSLIPAGGLDPNLDFALPPNPDDVTTVEVPEGSLVVDSTFQTRRWIDTWGQVAVSRDGDTIAYQTQDDLTPMIRVENARTGDTRAELTGVKFSGTTPTQFAFSGNGESLVYLDGNDVWIATWDGELATTLVETGDMRPSAVFTSSMPDRVIIEQIMDDEIGGQKISVLDTSTGKITDLGARHTDSRLGFGTHWSQLDYVVTMSPDETSPSRTVMQLIDLHTGEPVLTSEPIQESIDTMLGYTPVTYADGNIQGSVANSQIASSSNGAVAVANVRDGQSIVFNAITATVAPVSAEWNEDIASMQGLGWLIIPSSDGEMLYGVGTQPPGSDIASREAASTFVVARVSSDSVWSEPSDVDPIGFIPGISARTEDEPTVLEAQEITPIAASPAASPATAVAAGCDLTGDMPIFDGSVPDGIVLDTYLLLDDSGTLTLNCDQTSRTIASGVDQVKPTAWPGAIALVMQDGTGQLLNLTNGATATLGSGELLDHTGHVTTTPTEFVTAPHSPWLVSIANSNRTDWRITDLRTMESLLLSDEIGGPLPEPRLPLITNGLSSQADIANGTEVAVIAFMNGEFETAHTPDAEVETGSLPSPGAALVLPGTLDARRWIDLSPAEARIPMLSAGVSADGSLLAYVTTDDSGDAVIRIERTTSGEDVATLPIDQTECPTFSNQVLLFVGSEPKLLYSDGCSIEIVSWSPDIGRMPLDVDLLSSDVRVYPTADPDVVLLEQGGGAMVIDVTDGTVIREFRYVPYLGNQLQFSDGHGYIDTMVTVIEEDPNDLSVIQVVNPITGEVLAASQTLGAHPVQLTQTYGSFLVRDGTLAILQLPPDSAMEVPPLPPAAVIVLDVNTGETWMIKLPPYDDWYLIASPDGRYLSYVPARTVLDGEREPFLMKSTGVGSDWVEVPAGSVPKPVIGTHALPHVDTGESVVLEAQENTPIAASPAATPAASTATCDLTGDMPIFVGTAPDAAFLDTHLLLDDSGTLTLNCDTTSRTIASGIAEVKPTGWPATIVLVTQDGTVQARNLVNGATLQLEAGALLNEAGQLTTESNELVTAPHSPWLISNATADHTNWRITDLRTMESLLLSDEVAEPIAEPHHPLVLSGLGFWNDQGNGTDMAAVAFLPGWLSENSPPVSAGEPPPQEAVTAEGNILLLPGSIEKRRWINVAYGTGLGNPSVTIHPDGSLIAYTTSSDQDHLMIRVEETADGTLVADIPLQNEDTVPGVLLTGSTPRLVISSGETVEIVSWEPEIERTPVDIKFLSNKVKLYPTADLDVVLVGGAVVINISDGTVIREFQHVPPLGNQLQFTGGYGHVGTMVTIIVPDAPADVVSTVQIVDPVTGDVLVESDPIDMHPTQLMSYGISLIRDGTLAVVPIGPPGAQGSTSPGHTGAILLDAESGETWQIDVPNIEGATMTLVPSPDGQLIYAAPARNVLDREDLPFFMTTTEPGAEWVEVSAESVPQFIIGTHDLP